MTYSIVNTRRLELFKPLVEYPTYKKVIHDDFHESEYLHFPIILKSDSSIWKHGSLYLLSKLEAFNKPTSSTLLSIANDLLAFINFIESKKLDYLLIPKRKAARPTYQFRFHLQDKINKQTLSDKTARRRMNAVVSFYEWLSNEAGYKFENDPFVVADINVKFESRIGRVASLKIKTSDVAIKTTPVNNSFGDYINDQGKLRPLKKNEQIILFEALNELGNVEMTLMFLIAISTGARLQTICTISLKDLDISYQEGTKEVKIIAGPSTSIDTKLNKKAVLYMPLWLLIKLKTYANSYRAITRRKRSNVYKNSSEQYLFLTKGGKPFYMRRTDPSMRLVNRPIVGNAITQFVSSRLLPKMRELGYDSRFKFHDLRATFGVNLIEVNQEKLINKEISYQKLKDFIRERMWHQSIDTTDNYLQFLSNERLLMSAQDEYENFLEGLMSI